jgi:MinD-like ATPase involved in chromosome partitioning or flagellar assembly
MPETRKPYVIRISSFKGGVGKTTIAINFSIVLAQLGKKVLLIDADPANASASFRLGYNNTEFGWKDVLYDMRDARSAIVRYEEGGIDFIPTGRFKQLVSAPTGDQIRHAGEQARDYDYDFIIIDSGPGYFAEQIATYYNESIIVSTLDEDVLETTKEMLLLFSKLDVKTHLVFNRVDKEISPFRIYEAEKTLNKTSLGTLPEDPMVREGDLRHKPACVLDNKASFCISIRDLGKRYLL